jgi:hypothetical protein
MQTYLYMELNFIFEFYFNLNVAEQPEYKDFSTTILNKGRRLMCDI